MSTPALVAYYSMSGNTRVVAQEIRDITDADLEEIGEARPRHGLTGVMRAMFDALTRRTPPILVGPHNPADYELLVIGGPVWAGRMAAPVRSYAKRYGATTPHVAFFCTEGGSGAESAFADLQALCGHPPEATLVVDSAHLPPSEHRSELSRFASSISRTLH